VTGQLGPELARQWPGYTTYLMSFLVVGITWVKHHATVRLLARTNHTLQLLNLVLLLSVSILPWPTAILSDHLREGTPGDQRVAVVLYGVSLSLMGVAFTIFWRYLSRHRELHHPDVTRKALAARKRRYNVGVAASPLATLLGLLSARLFIALIVVLAVLYLWRIPTSGTRAPAGIPGTEARSDPRGVDARLTVRPLLVTAGSAPTGPSRSRRPQARLELTPVVVEMVD
jgi:uncharacterized membrane protein